MKIGIYTLHSTHNVGGMLQAFSLVRVLKDLCVDVEVVNIYPQEVEQHNYYRFSWCSLKGLLKNFYVIMHPQLRIKIRRFEGFHNKLPLSKRYFSKDEYLSTPCYYDIHLVGSDQVWNCQKGYDYSRLFFLDYLPENSCKISYASSFGTTHDLRCEPQIIESLKHFRAISVREDTAAKFLRKRGIDCLQVLDPTLLLKSSDWDRYIDSKPYISGRYILFYGVNRDKKIWEMLKTAKKILHAKIIGIPGHLVPQYHFDKYVRNCGPLEYINIIKNATLVITSCFHGLAFSINYNKDFILLPIGDKMERMESLLRLTGLDNRMATDIEEFRKLLIKPIDYSIVNRILDTERNKSIEWMKSNINEVKSDEMC